jgi:hypothetical protein
MSNYNVFMEKNMSIPQASEKIGQLLQVIAPPASRHPALDPGGRLRHHQSFLGWRQAYISQHLMALQQNSAGQARGPYVYYRLEMRSSGTRWLPPARQGRHLKPERLLTGGAIRSALPELLPPARSDQIN